MTIPSKISTGLVLALVIGGFMGYEFYKGHDDVLVLAWGSVLLPSFFGLRCSYRSKKKLFWEVMSPSLKEWGLALAFTALALLIGAVVSTKLYCTYGACSEFAGLEILVTLMWIPFMAGISALVLLVGTVVLMRMRHQKF